MNATLHSVREVVIALGDGDQATGYKRVARLTGRSYKAVVNWAYRDMRFPTNTFLQLKAPLRDRGLIASPQLWGFPDGSQEVAQPSSPMVAPQQHHDANAAREAAE